MRADVVKGSAIASKESEASAETSAETVKGRLHPDRIRRRYTIQVFLHISCILFVVSGAQDGTRQKEYKLCVQDPTRRGRPSRFCSPKYKAR